MNRVAGTVILYNSSQTVISNIETYVSQVEKLYVVDNSTEYNGVLIDKIKEFGNVEYKGLDGNRGIAAALNVAATTAIRDGYDFLLTMDDDTKVPDRMIDYMMKFIEREHTRVGIVSGVHHSKKDEVEFRSLPYTLTSGNILSLEAYMNVGPFQEDFFIDHVDHEYGLRLNRNDYKVIELPYIRLDHKLGYSQRIKIGRFLLGKYGTHPPVRLYYFVRNGIYVTRKYYKQRPQFVFMLANEVAKRLVKAAFFDSNKISRISMIIKGIRDGVKGKLGEYNQPI